jgi:hypothetical protein
MTRLSILLAVLALTGCLDVCQSSCQSQYTACFDTGRTAEECEAMLANCEASCSGVDDY